MIPCFICGKDASLGWVTGYTPAPDSQKVALCAEHNTADNRRAAARAWSRLIRTELEAAADAARSKGGPLPQMVTLHFTAGGAVSFPCLSCGPTPHGTLCIEAPDGARTYVPLEHIQEYSVRPHKNDSDVLRAAAATPLPGQGGSGSENVR